MKIASQSVANQECVSESQADVGGNYKDGTGSAEGERVSSRAGIWKTLAGQRVVAVER